RRSGFHDPLLVDVFIEGRRWYRRETPFCAESIQTMPTLQRSLRQQQQSAIAQHAGAFLERYNLSGPIAEIDEDPDGDDLVVTPAGFVQRQDIIHIEFDLTQQMIAFSRGPRFRFGNHLRYVIDAANAHSL